MSTQHTPGPWILTTEPTEVEGVNVHFSIDSHTHISICGGQSQEHMKDAIYEDECRANARLIAAAPELLEALKGMVHLDEEEHQRGPGDIDICKEVQDAYAAIAKATGAQA